MLQLFKNCLLITFELLQSLLKKVVYCIDVLSGFSGQTTPFCPSTLAAWNHNEVFSVDSSWVFDSLLSSAPGWRKPPWDIPWVRKQGKRGRVSEEEKRRAKRKCLNSSSINKSPPCLINNVHFPVWEKKLSEIKGKVMINSNKSSKS